MKRKKRYSKMLISGKSLCKCTAICAVAILSISTTASAAASSPSISFSSEHTLEYVDTVDTFFAKREQLLKLYSDIKSMHEKDLKQLTDELKAEIADGGYDYDLTFEFLNEKGDPLRKADYTGMLSAYIACKEYRQNNSLDLLTTFADIPILNL